MNLNEKGITLVELLAALLLVSIIGIIAWTALGTGMKHNAAETSKTQLQQEANLITTKLSNGHRRSDSYFLQMAGDHLEMNSCKEEDDGTISCSGFSRLSDNQYLIEGQVNAIEFKDLSGTEKFEPESGHVSLKLKVIDPANTERFVEVETKLTRILTER